MKNVVVMTVVALATTLCACDGLKKKPTDDPPPPPTIASARETVPPAAPFNATPAAQLADAGNAENKSPLELAREYKATGQLWMARLHLEQKALGPDGTKEEAELLLQICMEQGDPGCVEKCGVKLGRKIKFDGGAPPAAQTVDAGGEHREPDTDLAQARDLVLKMKLDPARKLLEQKVLDGKASREEVRMLKTICEKQGDRMCVALCNTKLK